MTLAAVRMTYFLQTKVVRIRYRKLWAALARSLGRRPAILTIPNVGLYEFDLTDGYWNRLVSSGFAYEPELERVLFALSDVGFAFLDCGANYGFWSVYVSSPLMGAKRCLAIEASAESYEQLQRNAELNDGRFATLRQAISNRSGKQVAFSLPAMDSLGGHSARHIVDVPTDGDSVELVGTVSIDDAVVRHFGNPVTPLVIKLDVEGAEVEALEGGCETLKRDCLLLYEDHGKDGTHAVTRYIRSELGLQVYFLPAAGDIRPVHNLHDLDAIKVNEGVGYNFLALHRGGVLREALRLA